MGTAITLTRFNGSQNHIWKEQIQTLILYHYFLPLFLPIFFTFSIFFFLVFFSFTSSPFSFHSHPFCFFFPPSIASFFSFLLICFPCFLSTSCFQTCMELAHPSVALAHPSVALAHPIVAPTHPKKNNTEYSKQTIDKQQRTFLDAHPRSQQKCPAFYTGFQTDKLHAKLFCGFAHFFHLCKIRFLCSGYWE